MIKNDVRKVEIRIIPHAGQRYPTVGDWIFRGKTLRITVSDMGDNILEMLVAVHEYIEAVQCMRDKISGATVDSFDMMFEEWRKEGRVRMDAEPGNDTRAPYFKQHQNATEVERKAARLLGVDWDAYDKIVNTL